MPLNDSLVGSTQGAPRVEQVQVLSANGAVKIASGVVLITKGTAAAVTISDPGVNMNGAVLRIVSTTDAAHTVTYSTTGFNGGGAGEDIATFDANAGCALYLVAYGGVWYSLSLEPGLSASIA